MQRSEQEMKPLGQLRMRESEAVWYNCKGERKHLLFPGRGPGRVSARAELLFVIYTVLKLGQAHIHLG